MREIWIWLLLAALTVVGALAFAGLVPAHAHDAVNAAGQPTGWKYP